MKEKIIEASIRLFENKGYSETSIQDIVDELGVTKGTFYYYFSSKEELLMEIHQNYIDHILKVQEDIISDESKNNRTKLFEIIYMLLRSIKTHGPSALIFFREMNNLSEASLAEIIPKRDKFRFNIEKVVQEGISSGEFRSDLNPSIITLGILGMTNWSYKWFKPDGPLSDKEVSEIYTEIILHGIEKEER
ncbi:TetR/AcrR family transcriptional regulator [Ureibacillus thermosphaericus]|uniref:TetR/AcrR family transcriptional regulator n=1 Tax=Ureibacillus thermosphaericus TaxID=51173 RepID=UPI0030C99368